MKKISGGNEPIAEVLNLGAGKSVSIIDLANMINNKKGARSELKILSPMNGDPTRSDGDYENLRSSLSIEDFKFTELTTGLDEVIEWIESEYHDE